MVEHLSPVLLLPLMFLWNRSTPRKALATSVLYLVPGVQLVNAVIDLIEGYVLTAIARGFPGISFIVYCCGNGFEHSNFWN